ncbi:Tm-1-like ATP-binding domain-containing protein [Gemmata sp. JC673]|uniref:Tm-1-like ATP-binding domain-containing protein n=1 Tax=Gemmata algarum TaxID=2975278 RepID=A0ABU5F7E4_9BACT|nr:Tm-1-like ATP-binding domain-containing protein [Gemmata algarum]MDY3563523.1 Tm-1-like ATP-binding domain-containing protein [Gemmata algarum]
MSVLLVGTLDTKGAEFAYVRDRLRAAGVPVLVADAGVIAPPAFAADVSREELFRAAGASYESVKAAADRGKAIELAATGAAKLAAQLHKQGRLSGVLGMGGSAGTTIGTAAMRALPVGVPKLMVSTLAGGQVQPYVGTRDVMMMHSVVDIAGLNRISRAVLDNAANAMIGMAKQPPPPAALSERTGEAGKEPQETAAARGCGFSSPSGRGADYSEDRPVIAATMFGVTTPCVEAARKVLEAAGYEVIVFHATGTGGRTMEGLIRDGLIAGVLDITTTELADELVGGVLSAGPERLTAAAVAGMPQVVSLGALDMVNFGPYDTVPEPFQQRRLYRHNPTITLMRTTPEEMDQLGKVVAERTSASNSPTCVMVPLRGVSAIDAEGMPFWWPEADEALFQSLRNWIAPYVELTELDLHINDPAFAESCAQKLLDMLKS